MHIDNLETYMCASIVSAGADRWHPAIRYGSSIYYWPNRKFLTEDEAHRAAQLSLDDAITEFNRVTHQWNVIPR